MEISKGIQIVDTALWFEAEKVLIINDLHIGYEESLHLKGVLVPRMQLEQIMDKLKAILLKTKPIKVIINGDLKHEFGKVLRQEWREVLHFLDFLLANVTEVIIIKGNHDPIIKPIADKKGILVVNECRIGETLIVHGDELVETDAKRIVIGHEHPAITIREGSKWEKYKCFLKGSWKGKVKDGTKDQKNKKEAKELIAVPSFNPLLEGTDVLKEEVLSPFLENIKNFEVYVVGERGVYFFGKIKNFK
ncbi:metallophosphoesterase [Candidatus Woesearchaeota archaeon]|nr:metallophosphoesterase [Candidatus Woesearchaeota archaeon]